MIQIKKINTYMCKVTCKCVIKFQIGDVRVRFEYAGLSGESQLGSPAVVS